MKLIHLTDIHDAGYLIREAGSELSAADLVVVSGDITHFGHAEQAEQVLKEIRVFNPNIVAVSGNCDFADVEKYLDASGTGIHLKIVKKAGVYFTGIGGSLPCPGSTPNEYTEEKAGHFAQIIMELSREKSPLVVVSHQPPP